MKRIAFISGVAGQDGSYLAEFLVGKGYEVHGLALPDSSLENLRPLLDDPGENPLTLHSGDLRDRGAMRRLLERVQPDELYNLAAQSHVGEAALKPEYTAEVVGGAVADLLATTAEVGGQLGKTIRFCQAGSAEAFGRNCAAPCTETSPFNPSGPYAEAKAFAHQQVREYRERHGLFAGVAILFNHESPRRGENFVTRKITRAAARIKLGLQRRLALGNLKARRDWGFAGEYVEAMWLMLQQPRPDDFVIATGETHSVEDFVNAAFDRVGLEAAKFVDIDPALVRDTIDVTWGNPEKARRVLGWNAKVALPQLVNMMVDSDLELVDQEGRLSETSTR